MQLSSSFLKEAWAVKQMRPGGLEASSAENVELEVALGLVG